jgi:Zn-dependent metalloprotease
MRTLKVATLGIFFALALVSCESDKSVYCTSIVNQYPGTAILSDENLAFAQSLFKENKIDYKNYQFYSLFSDGSGGHGVKCHQYVNNLKVFTDDLSFIFNANDLVIYLSGEIIRKIDLDARPCMERDDVVELFLGLINEDTYYSGEKDSITTGCFELEFGYWDLNSGTSNSGHNFVKAWRINPKGQLYPYAFIDDINSESIYYFNGIYY